VKELSTGLSTPTKNTASSGSTAARNCEVVEVSLPWWDTLETDSNIQQVAAR
jgi:hypothetical protein